MNQELFTDHTTTHSILSRLPRGEGFERLTLLDHIPLSSRKIAPVPDAAYNPDLTVVVYANCTKVKQSMLRPPHLVDVKRGKCSLEFNGKVRKRCIDTFNMWRMPFTNMLFLHLTYPDEYPLDWHVWKLHLKWYKALLMRQFPNIQGMWKLELQKRGAPHYHMVLDLGETCSIDRFRTWNDAAWARIAHADDVHGGKFACRAEPIFSIRHARNYAAKYQGKACPAPINEDGEVMTSEHMRDTMGRLWGKIGKLDCSPSETRAIIADLKTFIRLQAALELHRRGARGWKGLLKPRFSGSFTIYGIGDNADDRFRKAGELIADWEIAAFSAHNLYDLCFEAERVLGGQIPGQNGLI